ncbi:MAG: hypothetical protein A3F92_16885 [Candidatus Rokubacteria bacterium RIFCSPLOWO2_12_FULL_71_22]|nr:MAG: hypothetical protein A3F92_16885 [Candidatus Rokubacteria bacterium RIFCSPLOWO2_12_FULL_71_22]
MLNVDKLFPRLSIRAKLVVAFCFFGVVPVAVVGGYGALHSYILLNDATRDRLKAGVVMKAEEMQRFLRGVHEDVLYLAGLPTVQALVDLPPGAGAARDRLAARLGNEFLSFSRARSVYHQVRFIDETGREVVRVDFDGERPHIVASGALQSKRDRYYFTDAMATPPGSVYVSPMDLNVEHGAVELPHRPAVRYAVPLRPRGEPRGIVILNLHASKILGQVLALGRELGSVSLSSSTGYYLSRSEWVRGATDPPFARRAEWLSRDFAPALAATILGGAAGTLVEPGFGGRIAAYAPIFPHFERRSEFWVLTHAYGKREVLSSIWSLQLLVMALGAGVLGIAVLLGVVAARHFTRPITALSVAAEAVASGDYAQRVRVETNDELEDLARHFTQMATGLERRERELRDATERAERKAMESQALYGIGTEVLGLLALPRILDLVADKARALLRADVAILCVGAPDGALRLGAVSGATRVLDLAPGDRIPVCACARAGCVEVFCPAVVGTPFATHLAVPMKSRDRVVGDLCVAFFEPRSVGSDEREFLTGLANLATIAIEKARLHDEVTELTRLEERERIAADLHDGIIQSIYAAGLGLEECLRLADEAPAEMKRRLDELIDALNVVIRDVRNYVVGLRPERLQDRDISQALAELARGLSLNGLLDLDLELEPGIQDLLTPPQTAELYHICREALTNVIKHARASRVVLSAARDGDALRVTVEDDGVGFEVPARRQTGQGLHNMADRARRLGGDLAVESARGRGTRITVAIPAGVAA